MARKLSDTSRQEAWGWRPPTPLDAGIMKTYQFYLETLTP